MFIQYLRSSGPLPYTAAARAPLFLSKLDPSGGALRSHFKHGVMFARVLCHLQPEIVIRPYFGDRRTVNFERFDPLGEIGGVSVDVDYVADAQRSIGLESHGRD